jgi:SAM-dependent methyltransferase
MKMNKIFEILKDRKEKDFNKWIAKWDNEENFNYMQKPYEDSDVSYIAINLIKNNSKVLAVGCGSGREVKFLVKERYCNVTAIDISKECVSRSKKFEPNAKYLVADGITKRFENKFDYVICLFNTINYFENEEKRSEFIRTSYDNLKEGGKLIIVTSNAFSAKGKLIRKLLSGKDFHYFPSQIDRWFNGTYFNYKIIKVDKQRLIIAEK